MLWGWGSQDPLSCASHPWERELHPSDCSEHSQCPPPPEDTVLFSGTPFGAVHFGVIYAASPSPRVQDDS